MRRAISLSILTEQSERSTEHENRKSLGPNWSRLHSLRIEEHTKIFASMCPDEILDHYHDYDTRMYHTTLMLGDVSGFTELTEKYTKSGKGGPSKLTETLNSYIGAMVQEILSHNGDVLKFSGDAFIVMWKLDDATRMRDIAIEALQTACVIQKHFGTYETDVGVTLRVKLAISSGKTYFTSIGHPDSISHYIITGKPVWDVKYAETMCRGGDILASPSCWQWANPDDYVYESFPDGIHTLVFACSAAWYQSRTNNVFDKSEDEEYFEPIYDTSDTSVRSASDRKFRATLLGTTLENLRAESLEDVDYSLRPKVIKVGKARLKSALKSYMLRPVVRSVEMDEPLEYLTEMRQVVIVFVNVVTYPVGKRQLIPLVKSAYKRVCWIVGSMQGCVNKTSLFDKDLMFLCIFGLRGDKHELESQIGLRCATKIRESLRDVSNVRSVTVAVTTGITYCGVVGHVLRREYTVIGMPVNKAARLMVAYTNKVICDRESFLHSCLETKHFLLQEPKPLKGITSVGPVYEFQENAKDRVPDITWSKYPLLGREKELQLFQTLLSELLEYRNSTEKSRDLRPSYNTLIVKGEPRIGKTRLMVEILRSIPSDVFANYVSLSSADAKIPYALLRWIFAKPLTLNEESTAKDREDLLLARLRDTRYSRYSRYLCALNQPFNVRFPISQEYNDLTTTHKQTILRKFILALTKSCFDRTWVIIVDDAEYSDIESLELYEAITKRDFVLFVLAVGRKLATDYTLYPTLIDRAQIIELGGIDKWHHAALACQVLNARGVPAELEKLIQERSAGNPGWIESYLVSLMQAGGIIIANVSKKEAESLGLVLPDINMIKRSVSEAALVDSEDEERTGRSDKWQMYRPSYKDSSVSIVDEKHVLRKKELDIEEEEGAIAICKIPSGYQFNDTDLEISMDVMILKLFDTLTPLDQLLLKCASVLGDVMLRKMLESLMEDTSLVEIGIAVTKLFDIRVFACAVGHFDNAQDAGLRVVDPKRFANEIRCYCTGITYIDELKGLPQYASCGLIRFKMSMFRETTYRLLTENQKMELHSKALKYLRQTTKRCKACGEEKFETLLGRTRVHQDTKLTKAEMDDLLDITHFYGQRESEETQGHDLQNKDNKRPGCLNIFRKVERKPTNTYSAVDFTHCRCNLILTTAYTQILDHCVGIGRKDLTLTAILEFVEVCLATYNAPYARKLLANADVLLRQMFESSEERLIAMPYFKSVVETLRGRCYLDGGLLVEARTCLESALGSIGYSFPKANTAVRLKSGIEMKRLKLMLSFGRRCKMNNNQPTNYTEQLANCLTHLFHVFRVMEMKERARLAGIWALNSALCSSKDFTLLCACFTNMMIVAHICHDRSIVPYLENEGLRISGERTNALELQEFKVIAELYAGVFLSRWERSEMPGAISIGFLGVRLTQAIGNIDIKLIVLPRLVHLLMLSGRHSEVVSLLRELGIAFVISNGMDKSGRTWYYALCADVQLDTGLTILPFRACEEYYLREGKSILYLRDSEAQKRYFTSMWLWCIRKNSWEASRVWFNRSTMTRDNDDRTTVLDTITALKKLEGLLLTYVYRMNNRDSTALETIKEIRGLFKATKSVLKLAVIAVPRYILLRAYYHMIRSRRRTALNLLCRAKRISSKSGNKVFYTWAEHCRKSWSGATSSVQKDLWTEQSIILLPDWEEINANDTTIAPFTFPLPNCNI